MAKELPYFKFEPSEWDSGTIQMCSFASKGLFIDMCSLYWNRLGEVPYKLVLQKLCNSNASALQELLEENLFTIESEMIVIDFLDKQLNLFQETSEKRRYAANKRWNNASALQVQSKSNAIREEKRREEKRNNTYTTRDFKDSLLKLGAKKEHVNDWMKVRAAKKASNTETSLKSFVNECKKNKMTIEEAVRICAERSWAGFKVAWLQKENGEEKKVHKKSNLYPDIK